MDEKKLENLETEKTEAVEEVAVEEVAEEVTEDVVEEIAEEVVTEEAAEEVAEVVAEEAIEVVEEASVERIKAGMSPAMKAVVFGGGALLVLVIVYVLVWVTGWLNPYNMKYANTTGMTIKQAAEMNGYTLREYKKSLDLSPLMPSSTYENAANNSTTLQTFMDNNNITLETLKEYYGWGDEITEKTTIGEALDNTKLSVILGDDSSGEAITKFREHYGYGEEITGDTLYGEVRRKIEKKTVEDRKASEKEAKKADASAEGAVE